MNAPITRTVEAPGAVLTYDVRPADSTQPPLLLIGSPMGAEGFTALGREVLASASSEQATMAAGGA